LSELKIKEGMAERLSQLLLLDPLNTVSMVRQLSMFSFDVAMHPIETTPLNARILISDSLGIINGLVGDNKYQIVAVYNKQGSIACFEVKPTDRTKIATVKQLEELQKRKEVDDGIKALEDTE